MINNLIKRLGAGKSGSALIMTIVLTVLLAIIAVMFVAVARMDRASTSNIADNKSLDLAAKSITEIISKDLVRDTPGVAGRDSNDPNNYSDYPDPCNPWLASLEPYKSGASYNWLQISDVNGYLRSNGFLRQNVSVDSNVIEEYPDITLASGNLTQILADADGDGIADSKWIEFANMRSSKGRKIYAAVRVIDNGGMVNVNTADKFDVSSTDANKIDGSSQMQINLKGLLKGAASRIDDINKARCNNDSGYWPNYEKNVIWDYNSVPDGNYLPFDISDELELRYRYCIDSKFVSRFEVNAPEASAGYGRPNYGNLYDDKSTSGRWGLSNWKIRITDPNIPKDPNADGRHLLTAYNLDRIIEPNGVKMVNINTADVNTLYKTIRSVVPDDGNAAQIAVNIIDYRDTDPNVITVFPKNGKDYYGFERPCVYISELAYQYDGTTFSYAIELYKPYSGDGDPVGWQLAVGGITPITINWPAGQQFHVIVSLGAAFTITGTPQTENSLSFSDRDTISLRRMAGSTPVIVDSVAVPLTFVPPGVPIINSIKRDITPAKCIRRLWGPMNPSPSLGDNVLNPFIYNLDSTCIQAHPKNGPFTNVGEIGMIFRKPAYFKPGDPCSNVIGYGTNKTEADVRLDLADPCYQKLFKYLTVMDPNKFHLGDPNYINETRIKGRININTAPASVIAQLPWVSLRSNPPDYNNAKLARAIVAYRDKQNLTAIGGDYRTRSDPCGFKSIGELCNVNLGTDPNYRIDYYQKVKGNWLGFPDLTPDDAADDFEERDLIFARISDLVTVRSDIFTAYMLIRIGVDGPQKRYMVILDRSGVKSASDKVKIVAFQPVPQAR
jgi:DNA uptake protein ComE-like DNA-binding protein